MGKLYLVSAALVSICVLSFLPKSLAPPVAVYAQQMDECTVDGEVVTPQPGGFYGGWITGSVVGPFKGIPGSQGW